MPAAALACSVLALWAGAFQWPGATTVDALELSSLDHLQRQRAAERLGLRGGPDLRAGLIPLLDDPAPSVRLTAARILARDSAPEAIESATRWTISATPSNRRLGLDVLRDAPATLPAAALRAVERSLGDADVTVRLLAIDTLSRQRDLSTSLLPIAAATEDDNREVRLRAVRALGVSRDRRAVVPLLARLSDVDRQVRVEAINALAAVGDPRAAAALKRQLGDLADDVRVSAAVALGKLKIADAVPTIAAMIRRHPFDEFSGQALLALGDFATPDAIAFLLERLREPPLSDEVSAGLMRAGEAAVPALLAEAVHGTASSAAAAATLLGQLRAGTRGTDPAATRALTSVIVHRSSLPATAAAAAIAALGVIRDPESLPALLDAAGDPLAETRRACYRALIAIGDERALPLLDRGLIDHDAQVRALALQMGVSLGAGSASPALSAAMAGAMAARLGDSDRDVSQQAVAALVRLGRRVPATVAPLLRLLARAPTERGIADALELAATPADDAALAAAARHLPGEGKRAIAHALAAAHAVQPIEDPALIDLMLETLAAGGANAEAAADALARARPTRGRAAAIARAFATAEPEVQPRLCAALAALGEAPGRDQLVGLVADAAQPVTVRAAAAWALATTRHLPRDDLAGAAASRLALTRASTSAEPAVADNARAALAVFAGTDMRAPGVAPTSWVSLRLVGPDGEALAHQTLSVSAADGTTVWTTSGLDGAVRLFGLPPGPFQVRITGPGPLRARVADGTRAPSP